jgi:hypothetical protein
MKHSYKLLQIPCLALPALSLMSGCALMPSTTRMESDLQNVSLRLVAYDGYQAKGPQEVKQGGTIPNRSGNACYEWHMTFDPVAHDVQIVEHLKLPAAAPIWNGVDNTVVAADRMSAMTRLQFDGNQGQASHGWCVAKGDPKGRYTFILSNKGNAVGRLRFVIQELR